jgi:hypothetical protein
MHNDKKCFNSLEYLSGDLSVGGGLDVISISALLGFSLIYGGCANFRFLGWVTKPAARNTQSA